MILEGLCRIAVTTAMGDGPYPTCQVRQLEGFPSSDGRFVPAPYQPVIDCNKTVYVVSLSAWSFIPPCHFKLTCHLQVDVLFSRDCNLDHHGIL